MFRCEEHADSIQAKFYPFQPAADEVAYELQTTGGYSWILVRSEASEIVRVRNNFEKKGGNQDYQNIRRNFVVLATSVAKYESALKHA